MDGWWTALLNRVSLPEAPSTPFCFCFCFCCSLSSIFCSTVCVSGLHPADLQRAPTVCHACLSCVNRVCTAVGTQVTAQNLYFPSRSSSDLIRFLLPFLAARIGSPFPGTPQTMSTDLWC